LRIALSSFVGVELSVQTGRSLGSHRDRKESAVCDLHDHLDASLPPLAADEYVLDTPFVRAFIADVRARIDVAANAAEACAAVEPAFLELLGDRDWLPSRYQHDVPESGMGGGIGQWLLYRSADRSLCLFSLVVPSGSKTPIHDHLAWGVIGLYRGNQDDEFYRPGDGGIDLVRRRPLVPGDHYVLLPPVDDIHCVRTTSPETSVSIHLLASDTGCTLRHTYDDQTGEARPFRSGYANAVCEVEPAR
jgi:predicted metal-dependent enzyme (double-stranded beta helix superfamily)